MWETAFNSFINLFLPFTVQVVVAAFLLVREKANFRFKAYISIPLAVVIAFGGAFAVALTVAYIGVWNENANILAYTVLVVFIYSAFLLLYKIPPFELILMIAIAHTFEHVSYQISKVILDTGLSEYLWSQLGNGMWPLYTGLGYIIRALVFVGMYFIIARPSLKVKKYDVSIFMCVAISMVIYMICVVTNVLVAQRMYPDKLLIAGISLTFTDICILADIFVIRTLKAIEYRTSLLLMESILKSKYQQFEISEKNIQFINMKCHDLRKQLRNMKNKKNELTEEDFALLIDSLNFYDTDVKTGKASVDSFIQDRILYCKSLNITFTSLIDGGAFEKMEDSDVYFLLLNIVDNAIDAASKVEDEDLRAISLTVSRRKGVMVLEETNYFVGTIEPQEDGSLKSSREGIDFHGYGTKSIAYIVKKYDGQMEYDIKDNMFTLKVAI